ncbi:unnamed protein product [Mytilus edulis]|uniref:C1q domain-containing protein n=1 Tax=Mytilus edulis TaxID=6550 RepID=A0A8S3R879_MYTED|nr:unnamed protein product [Mytilus edulis]
MNIFEDKMNKMEQTHKETVNSLISKNGDLERRVYSVEQFQRNRYSKDEFVDASDVLSRSENICNKSSVAEQGPFEKRMKSLGRGIYSGRKIRSIDPGSASGTQIGTEMLRLHLFLLIVAVGGINSNPFVESVSKDAELSLDRTMRILVSEMKNLKDKMQMMEQTHQETVQDNRNLRTLVKSLTSKNEELESRVYSVEQFQRNRHQKDEFEDDFDVLTSSEDISNKSRVAKLGPFENVMKSLRYGIHSGRKTRSVDPISGSDNGVVAFTAEVKDPISGLGDNQVIPFKQEITDTHNAYHEETGIFTCPRAGLYAFFAQLLVYPDVRIEFAIAMNTDALQYAQGYSRGVAPNKYDSGSAFGIIDLAVGDKVWVYVINDAHEGSGDQVFKLMSSFSGYNDGVVAFSAEVMDPISNLGDNQVIPFKSVLINTQNAFHGPTGIFTCPRAGLYAFFAKLLVYPDARIEFALAKNSDSVQFAKGYSKGVAPNKYDSGSAFGMIHLAVGDRVWVYVVNDAHEGSGKQVVKWMSSFMGFCLN